MARVVDGCRAIAYETGTGGKRRIEILDLSSRRTREFIGTKQFGTCEVWAPDWSPVSDHIVFTSCTCELSIVGVDGTGLARLAESPVSLLSSRKPRSSRGASTANSLATAIR